MITKSHYYYMLPYSPWPLLCSLNAFSMVFSLLMFMKMGGSWLTILNVLNMSLGSFFWWVTYSSEFNLEGKDSITLETGIKYSMLLFISSEIFFFFSFFWSYFHFFMSPTMETGLAWPPFAVVSFDCLNVPLINTLLLLSSGVSVTLSHSFLISGSLRKASFALWATIALGLIFTILQLVEYNSSLFSISDSTFGSSFFMLTGFHGIHVIIGSLFLLTVLVRISKSGPSKMEHLSFEMAAWYWHFVDVVWIFLFFLIYYLNS